MGYKVQFLNDEEFDALPGNEMPLKAGVAYPSLGMAFVRQTGVPMLDAFNMAHELEHLRGNDLDEHFDKEHGAYYKKIRDVLPIAAPLAFLIPGIGPALGGALSSIGAGFSGALGAIPGIGGALSGAAGSIGSGIGSALGIGGSGSAATNAGYAANAGNVGAKMGLGLGTGTGVGSAAASSAGLGLSAPNIIKTGASMLGKNVAGKLASDVAGNFFGGNQGGPMGMFDMQPSQGSFNPQASSAPNMIAGASGSGSGGGPGASPGPVGGGAVSKLKQYLQQAGNQGGGVGGMF